MKIKFDGIFSVVGTIAFAAAPIAAAAQAGIAQSNTIPLTAVVDAVAKHSDKKFFVDPRLRETAVLLQDSPAKLSYEDFLTLLQVQGVAAVTQGNYVLVLPDANVRQMAPPLVGNDKHPLAEYVTKVMPVKNIPAALLVPLLRPLIPQQGHLVAMPCTNDLVIVDTYGNVQRLEQVIKAMDHGEPYVPGKCSPGDLARPTDKQGRNE